MAVKKCATCGKEMNMDNPEEYKIIMDCGIHRYVCSNKCMYNYYK